MKKVFILAIAVIPFYASGQEVIAKDSNGLVVAIKADFGHVSRETCTVVILTRDNFVLVGKNGTTAWYPLPFHSVKVIEHLKPGIDPVVKAEKVFDAASGRFHEQ